MWDLGRLAASKFRVVPLTARWRSSLYGHYRLFPKCKKSKVCTRRGNFGKADSPLSGVNGHRCHLQVREQTAG